MEEHVSMKQQEVQTLEAASNVGKDAPLLSAKCQRWIRCKPTLLTYTIRKKAVIVKVDKMVMNQNVKNASAVGFRPVIQ